MRSIRRSSPIVLTLRSLRTAISACFRACGLGQSAGAIGLERNTREEGIGQPVAVANIKGNIENEGERESRRQYEKLEERPGHESV